MLQQLEKNQEILPSMCDEAFFRHGVSREIPLTLLSLKKVLDTLEATPEVPRHTRLHSRGKLSIPSQIKKSPVFPSSSRDEGPFPFLVGKGILAFPSHLKSRQSQLETREELQGLCHNSKRTRCPNLLQVKLIPLHCLDCHPKYRFKTRWEL